MEPTPIEPVASEDIDFEALGAETQALVDFAGDDFYYVTDHLVAAPPFGCGMHLGTPTENARRLEALRFAAAQQACIWRANGGVGCAKVSFRRGEIPNTVEYRITVWKSPHDAFQATQEAA